MKYKIVDEIRQKHTELYAFRSVIPHQKLIIQDPESEAMKVWIDELEFRPLDELNDLNAALSNLLSVVKEYTKELSLLHKVRGISTQALLQ